MGRSPNMINNPRPPPWRPHRKIYANFLWLVSALQFEHIDSFQDDGRGGFGFKGGSLHDRNRHNRHNRHNRQTRHGRLFVLYFVGSAKGGQGALQNRQNRQNRHEGYPP